jgi:ubiquinone/menaquinone biosynthesis C-methylase UbiE
MEHRDHVALIRNAVPPEGGIWADFGSGEGAFTLALAELAGPAVTIYSVDRDGERLETQRHALERMFPDLHVSYIAADFTLPPKLPPLDGLLMANSLHFVTDKVGLLRSVKASLKARGRLVLVEYDADRGSTWVPYPLTYAMFVDLAQEAGFAKTDLTATVASSFLREMYCAVAYV